MTYSHMFHGRHVMIDTETVSLGKDAAFTQIGACAFYPAEGRVSLDERFERHVRLGSGLAMGRSLDPETIIWWLKQSEAARFRFTEGQKNAIDVPPALIELAEFVQRPNGRRGLGARPEEPAGVWSHGATFDLALLEDACNKSGLKTPWDYRRCRDTRTVFALANYERPPGSWEPESTSHHALSDAVEQSYDLINALHLIGHGPPVTRHDPNAGLPEPSAIELHPE